MKSFLRWFLPPLILLVGAGIFFALWALRPRVEARAPEVRPPLVETVTTRSEAVTARMGQRGRCFEIDRDVKPDSVRVTMAAAWRWFAMVMDAWATASVTSLEG